MNFTGKVRLIRKTDRKKNSEITITEIVIETAETRPQFYILTYFQREEKNFPDIAVNDIIYVTAELKGRQWIDPNSGEVSYFMSLLCSEIVIIKKGGNDEA